MQSDLLTVHKDLGRSLRGIKCSVVSTGTDATLPECFLEQFKLAFDYLGMEFVGCHLRWRVESVAPRVSVRA